MRKYNRILKERFHSWREIEYKIECLPTAFEKGQVFEEFVYAYLFIKKDFYQLSEIYKSVEVTQNDSL